MIIYLIDGGTIRCSNIEPSMDGNLIVDEYRIIPLSDVIRIS